MDKMDVNQLITLAELSENALYELYTEAISKLRNKNTNDKDRKIFTIRVCMIRSLISDKYSLKLRHSTPNFDDPLNNENVSRFFR